MTIIRQSTDSSPTRSEIKMINFTRQVRFYSVVVGGLGIFS